MDDSETFSIAGLVAPHPAASAAGRDVLVEGGNVIEAAIAAASVSAVVVPHRNGLGGDALWLVRESGPRGRVRVLDARGLTGAAASAGSLRSAGHDTVPLHGPDSVLVAPGVAAGWMAAYELSAALGGRLPLPRLLQPALDAARFGVAVSPRDHEARMAAASALAGIAGFGAAFLEDGKAPEPGTLWPQPRLARTIDYLIAAGLDDLYRGDVGRELAADLEELACPLARGDLIRGDARWRKPASLAFGRSGLDVVSNRRGLELALALGLSAQRGPDEMDGFDHWHGGLEGAKLAQRLVDEVMASGRNPADIADGDTLKRESLRIDGRRASEARPWRPPVLAEEAVFIGAVDRDGMAVSLVQSLGGAFGSGVVSGRTGLLLGNRGAAAALHPEAGPLLEPRQRLPFSSVPALTTSRDGHVTSLGATGPGAAVALLQVAGRLVRGATLGAAVLAPRFAFAAAPDGPETVVVVQEDVDSALLNRLGSAGHPVLRDAGAGGETATSGRTAASGRTASGISRLPSGRIDAASDDGTGWAAGV